MAANRKDLNDNEIIEMYLSGMSLTEIAKKLNTTHRTILLRLKKHTIERRNLSESDSPLYKIPAGCDPQSRPPCAAYQPPAAPG